VLSGIKSITLLDDTQVSLNDSCCQFLVTKSQVGCNRAESSVARTQLLNPMVEVKCDMESVASKTDEYFSQFDVVCATCCSLAQLLRLDDICHRLNIAFFAGDVFGFYGFMFANLHQHHYAEDVVSHPAVKPGDQKTASDEEQHIRTVRKMSSYCALSRVVAVDWSAADYAGRLKKTPKTYFIIRALLEFRSSQGRDPELSDLEALKVTANQLFASMGLPADFIQDDFTSYCLAAISPVCAITGGILAQEIIKSVSQRDAPHNNFFFYSGTDGAGLVDKID